MQEALVTTGLPNPLISLHYFLEFREVVSRNLPEFDGKFFVKIERDDLLKQKVLGMTGEAMDYDTVINFSLAYLDNAEYNPSSTTSIYNNDIDMPRRSYKWFNTSSDTENNVPIGAPVSYATGALVSDISTIGGDWTGSIRCRGTDSGGAITEGCFSKDADFLGVLVEMV